MPEPNEWNIKTSPLTVSTAQGDWTATMYESLLIGISDDAGAEEDQPIGQHSGVTVGANIKLSFVPSRSLEQTRSIRLIQFKNSIKKSSPCVTEKGWEIDAHSDDRYPWFGWSQDDEPRYLDNEFKAKMQRLPHPIRQGPGSRKNKAYANINVRDINGLPANTADYDPVRETPPKLKGAQLAQEGKVAKSDTMAAFIVDTTREQTTAGNKQSIYTTFAYDVANKQWLGGVSWGYKLKLEDGDCSVELLKVRKRSGGGPPEDEEGQVRELWKDSKHAPQDRVEIPP